ncbi:MAG: AMP-binding protein [Treponema sp.]|nr:AMP-binding protein [Treponema sp.]
MLDFNDYISDIPDIAHQNFISFLDDVQQRRGDKTATMYRTGKQREFSCWTYNEFVGNCKRIARGLLAAGLERGDRVVLWAENRPEWMATWLGSVIAGLIIVPVDFLVSEDECRNIIQITRAKAFFYSSRKKEFAASLATLCPVTVCISPENTEAGGGSVDEFESFGAQVSGQALPKAEDINGDTPASIVFTSGTTGFAKGVTLSHNAIISNVSAAIRILVPDKDDVFIEVLPLHHTYPTTCSFLAPVSLGVPIVIVEKIIGKVVIDDIKDAKVTFLIAVPLLFDKVKAALEQGYNKLPGILRGPLNVLRKIALAQAKKGNFEFGRNVFRFIRKKAGLASVRIMVAGGGPLSPTTADFFDSLGFNIVHGYGMSENGPLITVNTPRHKNNVSVGLPVSYTDIKILDVNEEGIGEIAVKSPSLMLGYFENEAATKEVFTDDGYLMTGDLGYRDKLGFLYISGRKKNLIVSSGGKNIYPEEIEAHFANSQIIGEILVIGRKEPDYGGEQIVAVIVPNFETIALEHPGKETDDAFIKSMIKKEIEVVNRSLAGYKKISDFIVRRDPFEKNAQQKIRRFMYKSYEN